MNQNLSCQSCRFWDPKWKFKKEQRYHQDTTAVEASNPRLTEGLRRKSNKGLCRRYAPHTSALSSVWMETKSTDWCGDHQPLEPA